MIVAIVQARMSSSRLPGKVLKPLLGEPMLQRQLERIHKAELVEGVIVATSVETADDAIAELCARIGVTCFRGKLDDVLDRFYQAAKTVMPEHVLRLTGDCPFTDPAVIDQVVKIHVAGDADYTSNNIDPSWPDGLDVEVASFAALETAWREATLASDREHVMPFLWRQQERFCCRNVAHEPDLSHHRWTVDEEADYRFVGEVFAALHPERPNFSTADVLELLTHRTELLEINANRERNEGYRLSLERD